MILVLPMAAKQEFVENFNMANLIIICGPQAVGKMTVAENLNSSIQ